MVARARRQGSDAGTRLPAGQQIPAAAPATGMAPLRRRAPQLAAGARKLLAGTPAGEPAAALLALGRPAALAIGGRLRGDERCIPRLSIVFFTTASGAGFALMAADRHRRAAWAVAAECRVRCDGAGGGRRCWRRAGWSRRRCISAGRSARGGRSRNGARRGCRARACLSVLTFVPAAIFGIRLAALRRDRSGSSGCAASSPRRARVATIYCTGMIYASLKPIRQWHNCWVVPNYLALGLMSGLRCCST